MQPFEGRFIQPDFLAKCVKKVERAGKYIPKVLILSEDDFQGLLWAVTMHGYDFHVINGYKALGLTSVVWAADLSDGEFLLSSGAGLDPGIETLVLDRKTTTP